MADLVDLCKVAFRVALALSTLIPHLSDSSSAEALGCLSLDSKVHPMVCDHVPGFGLLVAIGNDPIVDQLASSQKSWISDPPFRPCPHYLTLLQIIALTQVSRGSYS